MKTLDDNVYILIKSFQSVLEGKVIHTKRDIDKYDDFDSFISVLVKDGVITEDESLEYTSAYYDWYLDEYKFHQKQKLELKNVIIKPKSVESES